MKVLSQINVIPFIDIMLVLLAVVLTTATFVAEGRIPIELPQAKSVQTIKHREALEVNIDASGAIYLQGRYVDIALLRKSLIEIENKSTPVRLRVDSESEFSHFVAVIDLLKQLGLNQVSIIAHQVDA